MDRVDSENGITYISKNYQTWKLRWEIGQWENSWLVFRMWFLFWLKYCELKCKHNTCPQILKKYVSPFAQVGVLKWTAGLCWKRCSRDTGLSLLPPPPLFPRKPHQNPSVFVWPALTLRSWPCLSLCPLYPPSHSSCESARISLPSERGSRAPAACPPVLYPPDLSYSPSLFPLKHSTYIL